MADLPAEGRENLARHKRFLLTVSVVAAAYFYLGARVCDTATYSGFLVTIARPENARGLLLVVWAWALLTYLQRLYKLVDVVGGSIKADLEAEDYRLSLAMAQRIARQKILEKDFGDGVTDVTIESIGFKTPATRITGEDGRVIWRREREHYRSTSGRRQLRQFKANLVGVTKKTSDRWDASIECSMEWGPWFTGWHVFRSWILALLRRPAIAEHVGPLVAVALAICIAVHYWNNPPHPSECRASGQKIEAPEVRVAPLADQATPRVGELSE
jgi:hypothetical protein